MTRCFHVGTYAQSGGTGLYPLTYEDGRLELGQPYAQAPDASFGAFSRRFGLHYLLEEREEGAIRVMRREGSQWALVARVPSRGALPCYVSLDAGEEWLAVANYGSGSVALFRLDSANGLPGEAVTVQSNSGHGRDPERQEGPHAHCAIFAPDGKLLYRTDLGTDEILVSRFDPDEGPGAPETAFAAPPGSGPRHLVFHPALPTAYLVSELASTLTVLAIAEGELKPERTITTLPQGCREENLGGHIAVDARGERLYATNRGHDSVAVFALDAGGMPRPIQHVPSSGASPRFFLIDQEERLLIVANEEGGNVVASEIRQDGTLSQIGEAKVPGAAFLFSA